MKPMLAVNIETKDIRFPAYASAKVDGVRALVIDGKLRSRSLLPIPNRYVSAVFSHPALNGWDGELVVGSPTAKDVFRVTQSALSREDGKPNVTWYVFDNFSASGGFAQRHKTLTNHPGIVVLEQRLCKNEAELLAFEAEMLEAGYEGLIVRSVNGAYKHGRSTANEQGMLKVKRFTDGEAVILGVEEELANGNAATVNALGRTERSSHACNMKPKGRMGALKVKDILSGVEFNIGTGFDMRDREYFWCKRDNVVGKIVKYKSFLIGVKDSPRFPVYLGGREKWDM